MAILITVVIFHLLLGFVLIRANRFQRIFLPDTYSAITFLPPPQASRLPPPKSPTFESSLRLPDRTPKPSTEALQAHEASNAITVPNISLDAQAEGAGQQQTNNEEADKHLRNLAGPSDSQLDWAKHNAPLVRDHHSMGDTERDSGGQVITWVNDKCYWTTSGASAGMPQTTKVCKDPRKPYDKYFEDMRKKLDEKNSARLP